MKGPEVYFILYKPAVPGNIGAAARAMKTMGFSELRLIDPADHMADEAKMMAHGSVGILEKAKIFGSFEDAIADLDFIVTTTAKKKSGKVDYINSRELSAFIDQKGDLIQKLGIVFGSEESGLPNSILLNSNVSVAIPMAGGYPSLNLAQAVMVIAYEISLTAESGKDAPDSQQEASWKELQQRTKSLLEKLGIVPGTPLYHRIIERMSFMNASDARLAHSITSRLEDL